MSARWQSPLLAAVFISGLCASVGHAQCTHGGRLNPASPRSSPQQMLLQRQMLQQIQQVQQRQLMQMVQFDRQMRELSRQGPEALTTALRDPQAERRLLAALTIGKYGPALTDDLIERLTDDQASVRQAARGALVRLSPGAGTPEGKPSRGRSVDFGPVPDASRAAQKAAARKWQTWFERQQAKLAKASVPAAKGRATVPAAPAKEIAAAPAAADPLPQRAKPPG